MIDYKCVDQAYLFAIAMTDSTFAIVLKHYIMSNKLYVYI